MEIQVFKNDKGLPPGKLADVELHFTDGEPLAGLKLIGFAVWETRRGSGRNVTYPARSYAVNGERRSFALLRPRAYARDSADLLDGSNRLRDAILDAYAAVEEKEATVG